MPSRKKNLFKKIITNVGGGKNHIDNLLELRKIMPDLAVSSASCNKSIERIDSLVRTLCIAECCVIPAEVGPPPIVHKNCFLHSVDGRFDCDCKKEFAIDAAMEASNPNAEYHEADECSPKFSCPRHDKEASG